MRISLRKSFAWVLARTKLVNQCCELRIDDREGIRQLKCEQIFQAGQRGIQ